MPRSAKKTQPSSVSPSASSIDSSGQNPSSTGEISKADTSGEQSAPTTGASGTNAVSLLKSDHRKVEELFRRFKSAASPDEKRQLAEQVCAELTVHTVLEEEIFYPACRAAQVENDVLNEAQVEHDGVKVMIAGIRTSPPQDPFFDAKMTVLTEYVKHHVAEEEKDGGIFSNAQKTGLDLTAVGEKIRARKKSLNSPNAAPPASSTRSFDIQDLSNLEERSMSSRENERFRDDQGRFESDDRGRNRARGYARSQDDGDYDDNRSGGGRGRYGDPERPFRASEEGWVQRGAGSRPGYPSRIDRDEEDYGRSSRRAPGQGRGWYGDPEGHSRASEGGWEHRGGGSGRGYSSRVDRDEEDEGRSSGRPSGQGRGWFGDAEEHSRASEEGWEQRSGGSRRGYSSRSDRDEEDEGRSAGRSSGQARGWFGDAEGHARASEEGWQHRGGGSRRSGGSRGGREEDNGRSSGQGRGWHGDPEGHAEAARHRSRH